jgi:hypothetical protein
MPTGALIKAIGQESMLNRVGEVIQPAVRTLSRRPGRPVER